MCARDKGMNTCECVYVPPRVGEEIKKLIGELATLRYVQLRFVIYICDLLGKT